MGWHAITCDYVNLRLIILLMVMFTVVTSGTPRPKPGSSGIIKSTKSAGGSAVAAKPVSKVAHPASSRSPALTGSGGSSGSGGGASSAELKVAHEENQRLAEENQRLQGQVSYWSEMLAGALV